MLVEKKEAGYCQNGKHCCGLFVLLKCCMMFVVCFEVERKGKEGKGKRRRGWEGNGCEVKRFGFSSFPARRQQKSVAVSVCIRHY